MVPKRGGHCPLPGRGIGPSGAFRKTCLTWTMNMTACLDRRSTVAERSTAWKCACCGAADVAVGTCRFLQSCSGINGPAT